MTEQFVRHEPMHLVSQEAQELGLRLPIIEVSDRLETRLARHNATIEIDDVALFGGVKQAEIESPVAIKVDSVPKNSKKASPAVGFIRGDGYDGEARAHLRISPLPERSEAGSRKLNVAFWLGALVGESLAEGADVYPKRPGVPSRLVAWGGLVAVSGVVGSTAHVYDLIQGLPLDSAYSFNGILSELFGGVSGVAFKNYYMNRYKSHAPSLRKIEKRHQAAAEELASQFPVISYGVKFD